ncbi:PiggyBac transposable element-derived protein 4, partial [Cucumispora dikerogammari]
ICNIKLYTGVYQSINDTVKCLIAPFLHKNHKLYLDNYYNSFKLCEELIKTGVYCCGTMRSNRGEPEEYRKLKHTIKKEEFISHQKNNIEICLWHDKKVVSFISSFMFFQRTPTNIPIKIQEKPLPIKDYDKSMGGVDKYDQMVHSYFNERRSRKWTNKFFTYVINLCVHNSYILYNTFYDKADILNSQLKFRQALVKFLTTETTRISQDDIKRETDNSTLSPVLSSDNNHDIRKSTRQIEIHHLRSYKKNIEGAENA